MNIKCAVVLLSGGIDSTTTMAIAQSDGFEICALSFDYGQRHKIELDAATKIARQFNVKRHLIIEIPLRKIGGSALTSNIGVPKGLTIQKIGRKIPVTYVPARNTIFLSFALGFAEVTGAEDIYIGVNALDYSGYPDCRPEFVESFEKMANLATQKTVEGKMNIKIRTPLIKLTKAQIIRKGLEFGIDYSLTHSCYDPSDSGKACGSCESCVLRKRGFQEAGVLDPTVYSD
ncbi:MAG: 7-cyano-7-deazaguanine synthase QueC [Deltaproteobacteria bacterium]|nr:7-cyano-7-deazaguanine synthase QueC [Deltaproteobacteria bacterium]